MRPQHVRRTRLVRVHEATQNCGKMRVNKSKSTAVLVSNTFACDRCTTISKENQLKIACCCCALRARSDGERECKWHGCGDKREVFNLSFAKGESHLLPSMCTRSIQASFFLTVPQDLFRPFGSFIALPNKDLRFTLQQSVQAAQCDDKMTRFASCARYACVPAAVRDAATRDKRRRRRRRICK